MTTMFITLNEYMRKGWPDFMPEWSDPTALDQVWVEPLQSTIAQDEAKLFSRLLFEQELVFGFPGVDAIAFVLAPGGGGTIVPLEVDILPSLAVRVRDIQIALRVDADVLRPVRKIAEDGGQVRYEPDHSRPYVQIPIGEVTISVDSAGTIDVAGGIRANLDEPVLVVGTGIVIESARLLVDLSGDEKCIAFEWRETNLRDRLRQLSPALNDQGKPNPGIMALRVILGDPIREARLDWTFENDDDRTFSLPGLKVGMPATPTFTLLLGGQQQGEDGTIEDKNLSNLAFILTLAADDDIHFQSTFAWGRDEDRELQNEDEPASDEPLFDVSFMPQNQVSLVLLEFDLAEFKLPRLLRQLESPLPALDLSNGDPICMPTVLNIRSLRAEDWNGKLKLGLDSFTMPFLKEKESVPSQNQFEQFIELDTSALTGAPIDLNFDENTVDLEVGATLKLGPLQFTTGIEFKFNWETFSLDVDHDSGIDLVSRESELPDPEFSKEHLGLIWRFVGKPIERDFQKEDGTLDTETVYHYFTLATKNSDYQIQQAEGAKIEIHYTRASDEPIVFAVTDFKVTPKGISLTADVTDRPARLNGIDTRFRFHGTRIEIVENRIQDFTLAGSGPLPPALVGEAMADIALQFSQRAGSLTLVAGRAQLKGNKLLHCKSTRFQFSVDALGLKFVNDGKFHLYFTLTGSAQFVLAPGDDREGALALLPNIKIDMVECPLTGDMSVIAKHVKFLVELPSPKSFNFLGCFEMELRGLGFLPQATEFDGDGAMEITGQLKFAHGPGDTPDSRVDYHRLLIGLPKEGDIFPRIYFKNLPVNLNYGAAFKLNGVVEFIDGELEKGFSGEGMLEIQGLPTIAASFAFLRVRRDSQSPWLRAWFIYLEVRRVSFMIPVVQIYLREVGLGFGYRFTLVSIKTADRANDVRKLLAELRNLSRTQGDLSKRDRWEVDLEEKGEDPRWTIVLRALLAQTSAAPSPLHWKEEAEKKLSCAYLFDAVIAFRSDLTFFMAVRGWINTNYYNYDRNTGELKTKPLASGFVLLSPRQKRFLAHLASNPEGYIGDNPPFPDLVKEAIKSVRFSATLLIEPGLFHFELGWPNMLRWGTRLGPLAIENRGGFIFRVSETELVIGISYLARGSLNIEAGVDLGLVGVRVSASASLAYGGRLISVIKFDGSGFWIYGGLGLEMYIRISIEFWIRIPLIFTSIKLSYRFSVGIGFTAGLEVGITSSGLGLRGRGTISLSAMGHSFHFSASFAVGEGAVKSALMETKKYLNLGLEATDVEALPGLNGALLETGGGGSGALVVESASRSVSRPGPSFATAATETGPSTTLEAAVSDGEFHAPGYSIFVIREPDQDGWSHFVLLPQGEDRDTGKTEPGFLPAPPLNLMVKLVFWSDFLDKKEIPPQLRAKFASQGEALSENASVSVERFGEKWLIIDQTTDIPLQCYQLEDTGQELTVIKTEEWAKQFDFNTDNLGAPPYDDPNLLPPPLFLFRLEAFPSGPYHRYLRLLGIYFRGIDERFYRTLKEIFVKEGGITFSDDLSVAYVAGEWILSDAEQQYRIRLSNGTLMVWEILQTEDLIFSIERDRQSYELNQGQIPQEVVGEFAEGATVSPHETKLNTWLITETDPTHSDQQNVYTVHKVSTKSGDTVEKVDECLEINLEIDNDFTLHIPNVALFALEKKFEDSLNSGDVSQELKGEFTNHGVFLLNPVVTVVVEGSEWLVTDPETPAEGQVQFEYLIKKKVPGTGVEKLNVYGGLVLEQFDPLAASAQSRWVDHTQKVKVGGETSWQVRWEAEIFGEDKVNQYDVPDTDLTDDKEVKARNEELEKSTPRTATLTLVHYIKHAFKLREFSSGDEMPDQVVPIGDPDLGLIHPDEDRLIEDDRVYNPTDSAFEAAVRGAVEQFEGSPFFKKDLNYEYDRVLDQAFGQNTTIYHEDGELPDDPNERQKAQNIEQAIQLRGMVIHDLIADLRDYARGQLEKPVDESIPFQMGLVFRFKGKRPPWLDEVVDDEEEELLIRQRLGPKASAPAEEEKPASTFNIIQTDFSKNPPQFQRVQQLTDADTIALTWDLVWPNKPAEKCTRCQAEPEHHLAHYQVLRRALDGTERDVVYTVKSAQVLHREVEKDGNNHVIKAALKRLKPRFQVVDHFTNETLSDIVDLPAVGRSYLYTITPVDFEGNLGRPLTLIATRKPNVPPLVPVDGELVVRYRLTEEVLSPEAPTTPVAPQVVVPNRVHVEWTEPAGSPRDPRVPVAKYRLIFRQEPTLPIGSYGLDSTTQGPRAKVLPTTNARPLPTDIKIDLDVEAEEPDTARRSAEMTMETLRQAGVFPAGDAGWRPESWRVFFQAISVNNVPSALAPVQLLLRVEMEPEDPDDEDLQDRREERRPAELEWLAYPIKFPMLPPEDERATPGQAHFPMPSRKSPDGTEPFKFSEDLTNVEFHKHPAAIRCLRFRWNQGPSHLLNYPLDLNAGYEILELDIDAHTDETFDDREKLAEALRNIQEVQMLPAEDLLLTPGDTLTTNQWEAWYPSAVLCLRPEEQRKEQGSDVASGPWYSWRESILEWPDDAGFIVSGERLQALHPALQAIVNDLKETYTVDLQISPPIQPNTFESFIKSTATESDPYGWGILQRFGLSVAFSLRDPQTGRLIVGDSLLTEVKQAVDAQVSDAEMLKHLFAELLFQPGRSVELQPAEGVASDRLLAIVQLSLRPVPRQYLKYSKLKIRGAAQRFLDVFIDLNGNPASYINQADPASGQTELEPVEDKKFVQRRITLPLNGETTLLFRSKTLPDVEIGFALPSGPDDPNELDPLPDGVTYVTEEPKRLVITDHQAYGELDADEREGICRILFGDDLDAEHKRICEMLVSLNSEPLAPFAATDELATYFLAPENLAETFKKSDDENGGQQWYAFRRYAQALNSGQEGADSIQVPTEEGEIKKILVDFLYWSQRFFDACGAPSIDETTKMASMGAGPWLATAYPRAGSPACATPDENGRLKHDHLFEDKWAHNYRYYIRPYGRYDLLWQSFRQSPSLFPRKVDKFEKLPPATPDPEGGGLDVVIDRTHPVDKPLILGSRRLDRPISPGQPVPPGPMWEVIVAQHAEQSLIERNQTLARQLAFRHIAFTLLRRFTYARWIEQLQELIRVQSKAYADFEIETRFVDDHQVPAIPDSYPGVPDHINLDQDELPVEVERSLALPERLGTFQQGAMALQWEALPFYYTHRLLVVAQTASNVSPINQVIQRDFEYRSPVASGVVEGVDQRLKDPPGTIRVRRVEIPLQRFWDSLPEAAQQQWPSEEPDPKESQEPKRKFSSLPDPEVVYQIVEKFGGNIEAQVEIYFDQGEETYLPRQLGRTFITEQGWLQVIPPETSQGDFLLALGLMQSTQEKLVGRYDIPPDRSFKLQMDDDVLQVLGVFTKQDYEAMTGLPLADEDVQIIQSLYQGWFSREPVSEIKDLSGLPDELQELVDFVEATGTTLVWEGTLSPEEEQALLSLPGDRIFKEALARLAEAAARAGENDITIEKVPLDLPEQVGLTFEASTNTYTAISWTGLLFDEQKDEEIDPLLADWAEIPEFVEAIDCLLNELDERTIVKPVTPPRPLPEELPDVIQARLLIGDDKLDWTEPAPRDAEREGLDDILEDETFGDEAFRAALMMLLEAIDAHQTVDLPQDATIPDAAALPEAIRDRWQIILDDHNKLVWPGPAPSDEERAALMAVIENADFDPKFVGAVEQLLDAIDALKSVAMDPLAGRPRQSDLPALVNEQLTIEPTRIQWRGRVHSQDQFDELAGQIDDDGDPAFNTVIEKVIDELQNGVVECPLGIPLRHRSKDLPDVLRDKLLIGNATIRYHGLMKADEGRAIRDLFELETDRRAIGRLYTSSMNKGMRGRALVLRTRRGSATVSQEQLFISKPLNSQ